MQIVIVTDAWEPQVNGVVRNYQSLIKVLVRRGHTVRVISPLEFKTVPCPTYPEISLSLWPRRRLERLLDEAQPDVVHVPTEGPLGWAARAICRARGWPFTTCYHSKFPEYIQERTGLPVGLSYNVLRRFHGAAHATMVTNKDMRDELAERGFGQLALRRMGVDHEVFAPTLTDKQWLRLPRPIFLCHGRIAPEKNLPAFMQLKLPGSKVVIGPGPLLAKYRKQFPDVHFMGYLPDDEMVRYIAAADCFVFPSVTETFGFVQLEALACGVPVAAFPVTGPRAVLGSSGAGVMARGLSPQDLGDAAFQALQIKPERCLEQARRFSWDDAADDFLSVVKPIARP